MTAAMTILRLSFILLFGAMSMMHGPVMTFSAAHVSAPTGPQQPEPSDRAWHHAAPDCHDDQAPAPRHGQCNAFACFMAVEPLSAAARPLHPVLFKIMAAAPVPALDPLKTQPALPPPRVQS
jgi:hypothetical protein